MLALATAAAPPTGRASRVVPCRVDELIDVMHPGVTTPTYLLLDRRSTCRFTEVSCKIFVHVVNRVQLTGAQSHGYSVCLMFGLCEHLTRQDMLFGPCA